MRVRKLKNAVFWDVVQCRSCVKRRFGGTCSLHLQGTKIRERVTRMSMWLQSALANGKVSELAIAL
jgi:hypothetical protein